MGGNAFASEHSNIVQFVSLLSASGVAKPTGIAYEAGIGMLGELVLRTVDVERLIDDDHSARSVWELVGRLRILARTRSTFMPLARNR